MPLRTEMPASVIKPISAATDSGWPDTHSPSTAPTSASGMLAMMRADSVAER